MIPESSYIIILISSLPHRWILKNRFWA